MTSIVGWRRTTAGTSGESYGGRSADECGRRRLRGGNLRAGADRASTAPQGRGTRSRRARRWWPLQRAVPVQVDALVGRPRAAQPNVAVQIFQTAASLENVAISAYASALDLPSVQEQPTHGAVHRNDDEPSRRARCGLQRSVGGARRRQAGRTEPAVCPSREVRRADLDRHGRRRAAVRAARGSRYRYLSEQPDDARRSGELDY